MRRRISPAKAPIRKQLVKKIVSYYDTLERDRSLSRSSSPKRGARRSIKKTLLSPKRRKKSKHMKKRNKEYYINELHQNAKLSKLETLMKSELAKTGKENVLDHPLDKKKQSLAGYPSFMRETKDRLKHKNLQKKPVSKADEVQFKDPIYKKLKEKVEEANKDPIYPGELEDMGEKGKYRKKQETSEDRLYDELYHLNTRKNYVVSSGADADLYDFHQRKSKEIRRLQYSAGLARPKRPRVRILKYRVWVVFEYVARAADLKIKIVGKKKPNKMLEVKEKDDLVIELHEVEGVAVEDKGGADEVLAGLPRLIEGLSGAPVESDGECDFVAVTSEGVRWPVLLEYRDIEPPKPPTRDLQGTNCNVYGPDGELRGRGRFTFLDSASNSSVNFSKGYLVDAKNVVSTILIKRLTTRRVLIKQAGRTSTEELIHIEEVLLYPEIGANLYILALREPAGEEERQQSSRVVYYVDAQKSLENIELITGQKGLAECNDTKDYKGTCKYDAEKGFKVILDAGEDGSDSGDSFVRIVLDEDANQGPIDPGVVKSRIDGLLKERKGGPCGYCNELQKVEKEQDRLEEGQREEVSPAVDKQVEKSPEVEDQEQEEVQGVVEQFVERIVPQNSPQIQFVKPRVEVVLQAQPVENVEEEAPVEAQEQEATQNQGAGGYRVIEEMQEKPVSQIIYEKVARHFNDITISAAGNQEDPEEQEVPEANEPEKQEEEQVEAQLEESEVVERSKVEHPEQEEVVEEQNDSLEKDHQQVVEDEPEVGEAEVEQPPEQVVEEEAENLEKSEVVEQPEEVEVEEEQEESQVIEQPGEAQEVVEPQEPEEQTQQDQRQHLQEEDEEDQQPSQKHDQSQQNETLQSQQQPKEQSPEKSVANKTQSNIFNTSALDQSIPASQIPAANQKHSIAIDDTMDREQTQLYEQTLQVSQRGQLLPPEPPKELNLSPTHDQLGITASAIISPVQKQLEETPEINPSEGRLIVLSRTRDINQSQHTHPSREEMAENIPQPFGVDVTHNTTNEVQEEEAQQLFESAVAHLKKSLLKKESRLQKTPKTNKNKSISISSKSKSSRKKRVIVTPNNQKQVTKPKKKATPSPEGGNSVLNNTRVVQTHNNSQIARQSPYSVRSNTKTVTRTEKRTKVSSRKPKRSPNVTLDQQPNDLTIMNKSQNLKSIDHSYAQDAPNALDNSPGTQESIVSKIYKSDVDIIITRTVEETEEPYLENLEMEEGGSGSKRLRESRNLTSEKNMDFSKKASVAEVSSRAADYSGSKASSIMVDSKAASARRRTRRQRRVVTTTRFSSGKKKTQAMVSTQPRRIPSQFNLPTFPILSVQI